MLGWGICGGDGELSVFVMGLGLTLGYWCVMVLLSDEERTRKKSEKSFGMGLTNSKSSDTVINSWEIPTTEKEREHENHRQSPDLGNI